MLVLAVAEMLHRLARVLDPLKTEGGGGTLEEVALAGEGVEVFGGAVVGRGAKGGGEERGKREGGR